MGGMGGGPMDFGKSKSKFQEVPETGVKFVDVAVRRPAAFPRRRASLTIGFVLAFALRARSPGAPAPPATRAGRGRRQDGAAGGG